MLETKTFNQLKIMGIQDIYYTGLSFWSFNNKEIETQDGKIWKYLPETNEYELKEDLLQKLEEAV